jgi:crotonobetainyl-CoA:carnitine CoA-transferase CaiB-like acyl-CoA transferase
VHGLRIVDFGLGVSAALIAMQFAELGAQVLRIEPTAERILA